jgi:hypothetical protein
MQKQRLVQNFDTTIGVEMRSKIRGRNEVQKNKWTPQYQTGFEGESEKITVLCPENFNFRPKTVFKQKKTLKCN